MAFDQPIEADRVDDLGFLSSLIRAPVVGIIWLLGGGDHDNDKNDKDKKEIHGHERLGGGVLGDSTCYGDGSLEEKNDTGNEHGNSSKNGCHDRGKSDLPGIDNDDPPGRSSSPTQSQDVNKENKEPSVPHNWPSVGYLDSVNEDSSNSKNNQHDADAAKKSIAQPRSSGLSPKRYNQSKTSDCPDTQIIGDLVTAMGSSHISNQSTSGSPGPATSAVLSSQDNMTSSSANSFSATYSASTFSDHQSLHSSINNGAHPSQAYTQNNSNSSMRGNKTMSWSDECGNRSLVEYSDDSQVMSTHWSSMRRGGRKSSRRNSYDEGEKGAGSRRGEVRVIKSALKRSGSYSPPVTHYANSPRGMTGLGSESSSSTSSTPGMKSFRSLSVIGSSDSSSLNSSGHHSKGSVHSEDTKDSMADVTEKKLNSTDVQCVPSSLQVGCGRASGGLIIPRGGPVDPRYYFPKGCGSNDPRYQLILGAGVPIAPDQQVQASPEQAEKSQHHQFLPRHTNGYISPQYGFYVNITPPTPELYAARKGDKASRSPMKHQSYQQFQYQSTYHATSPIPEGQPGVAQGVPQRFVGRSSVPRPSSKKSSEEINKMSTARQSSLKPTFTKNKKGMGMLLAEQPHHGVWPSVPFG